ncbi:MAG: IS110 family transposase [Clostridia bacterium]|nr:IS110 family transposase [Clostridia bacterium]
MRKTELPRICIGVDLHKMQFTVHAVNEETGEVVLTGVFKTDNQGYKDFCEKLHTIESEEESTIELAVEATGNARYFKNKMEAEGFGVLVVNTSKFKVITMSTKKTDANDAATLAFYLSKDMLPQSHLCDQTSEEIRRMLKTRSILVSSTVKIKNQIHGMLLGYGIETTSAQFQSKKKRQELINVLAEHYFSQFTASSLEVTLNILDDIYAQVKKIEEQIKEMTKENETVELLMTMPGIGFVGATTIASYIDNIERFDGDFKKFSSYLGIIPSVHNSADTVRMGHITKRGPQELRTAFVQVAMGIIRQPQNTSEWKLMKDYQTMKISKGSGRAIIALTRKVARIVFAMLNNKEAFNPELMKKAM